MSFAGQALNMIKSTQMNREQLRRNRERMRDYRSKIHKFESSSVQPEITLEEFNRINAEIKAYEAERERKAARLMLIVYGIIFFLAIIVILIFTVF